MEHRQEIDGLRALAVLPVMFFHAGFETFRGGFVGVDIFFVISGYLITGILLAEKERGTFSLVKFYERRARRILPALFLVMLVCLPFAWLWLLPRDMEDFSRGLMAVSAFVSNIYLYRDVGYFDIGAELKPLLHTWSLAVEEQYYLGFPLLIGLLWTLRKRWIFWILVVLGLISFGLAQWGAYHKPAASFFLLPTRAWELLIGACMAFCMLYRPEHIELMRRNRLLAEALAFAGVALIAVSVFVFDKETPFPSIYAVVPTSGAALVVVFATEGTILGHLLSSRLLAGMGLISYSAYLWHRPLFAFARHRSLDEPGPSFMLLMIIAAVALAYISWKYVERPFRRADRVSTPKLVVLASGAAVGIFMFGMLGHLSRGYAERRHLEPLKRFIEVMALGHGQLDSWERIAANPSISSAARIGNTTRPSEFVIFGDSQAATLVGSLHHASERMGIGGLAYTFSGCSPLRDSQSFKQGPVETICNAFRSDFFQRLGGEDIPPIVVLAARWTVVLEQELFNNGEGGVEKGNRADWRSSFTNQMGYKAALRADIADSILAILNSGRRVVLIYPIPEMGWNVPARLAKLKMRSGSLEASDASTSYDIFKTRNADAIGVLDGIQNPNLYRIRPEELLCNSFVKDRCAAHLNGEPFYFDDNHLSAFGSEPVADQIVKTLTLIEEASRAGTIPR
jgi:peptidoglycan/LPS O-acetylase OafA/YrhL